MARDLKNLTESPSNLTHLDLSGVGLGIGAAELAAHLLCHPVRLSYFGCFPKLRFPTKFCQLMSRQVPPLRFLNIGGNSIGDDGAVIVSEGLVEAAGLRLLMLRFLGLDNNSMCEICSLRLLRELMPCTSAITHALFL